MGTTGGDHAVLVVDDEPEVADMIALHLHREYAVETVYGGEEALAALDDGVDVVLLDRRMPDLPGDEVLAEIRDRGLGCRVIMVSAVSPDFDIIEMPFDDYLCKPVAGETLRDAVERQTRTLDDDALAEYMAAAAKRELLEEAKSPIELERSAEYGRLVERTERLREGLDAEGGVVARTTSVIDIDRT